MGITTTFPVGEFTMTAGLFLILAAEQLALTVRERKLKADGGTTTLRNRQGLTLNIYITDTYCNSNHYNHLHLLPYTPLHPPYTYTSSLHPLLLFSDYQNMSDDPCQGNHDDAEDGGRVNGWSRSNAQRDGAEDVSLIGRNSQGLLVNY